MQNRIKCLPAFTGIDIPEQHDNASWSHNFINWLKGLHCKQKIRRRARDYMIAQMEYLRKELLIISNEIRKMMRSNDTKPTIICSKAFPESGP
ncbi:MAG: hypothetical protein ACTHML_03805 [Ginsengibacter sp.]